MYPPGSANALIAGLSTTVNVHGRLGRCDVARELLADVVDVALQRRIVVDAHLPADLGVLLLADRQFLGFAEQRHLLLAGHRVGGARGAQRDE